MALEIEPLRLTEGEALAALIAAPAHSEQTPEDIARGTLCVADAQLAKALWGVQRWLQESGQSPDVDLTCGCWSVYSDHLSFMLDQHGIKEPSTAGSQAPR